MSEWTTVIFEAPTTEAATDLGAIVDERYGPDAYGRDDPPLARYGIRGNNDYREVSGTPRTRVGRYIYLHLPGVRHDEDEVLFIDDPQVQWDRAAWGEVYDTANAATFRLYRQTTDEVETAEEYEGTVGERGEDAIAYFDQTYDFPLVTRVKVEVTTPPIWTHPPNFPVEIPDDVRFKARWLADLYGCEAPTVKVS